jgi:hypothetical protein
VRNSTTRGDLAEVVRLIDHNFSSVDESASGNIYTGSSKGSNSGATSYSLTSLFSDEQRRILKIILDSTLSEVESSLRTIYEDHTSLLRFLGEQKMPQPQGLALVASFALNASLRVALEAKPFNADELKQLVERATIDKVQLDAQLLGYVASQRIKSALVALEHGFAESLPLEYMLEPLDNAITIAQSFQQLPFEVNLWQAQNIWNALLHRQRLGNDANSAALPWPEEWSVRFRILGTLLGISVDDIVIDEGAISA